MNLLTLRSCGDTSSHQQAFTAQILGHRAALIRASRVDPPSGQVPEIYLISSYEHRADARRYLQGIEWTNEKQPCTR